MARHRMCSSVISIILYAHTNHKEKLVAQWMNRLYTVMEIASCITVPQVFFVFFFNLYFYLSIYSFIQFLNIIHNQFLIILVAEYQTVHILLS